MRLPEIIAAMPEIAALSLVKSLDGLDEKTTLKTWTIMETLVGFTGFVVALIISFFA